MPDPACWHLALSRPRAGWANMVLDNAMLDEGVRTGRRLPLLRLYSWANPTLSVGFNQSIDSELEARCRQCEVELVRRPTGGSAVLHGGDLTYAVVAPYAGMTVMDAYRWVAAGLIAGLGHLGLDAEVVRHRTPAGRSNRAISTSRTAYGPSDACFAAPVGADLQIGGRKICGSAQKRRRGWFLQHGSIPLDDDRAQVARLLDIGRQIDSTFLWKLRPDTSAQHLQSCLVRGFRDAWGEYAQLEEEDALSLGEIKRKGSAKVVLA